MDPLFLDWAFKAIGLGAAAMIVREMRWIRESIQQLNVRVAVVIEKTDNHEKRISKLEGD